MGLINLAESTNSLTELPAVLRMVFTPALALEHGVDLAPLDHLDAEADSSSVVRVDGGPPS